MTLSIDSTSIHPPESTTVFEYPNRNYPKSNDVTGSRIRSAEPPVHEGIIVDRRSGDHRLGASLPAGLVEDEAIETIGAGTLG